ncbi:hypothetical protein RRG08_019213 [Elysia crispata]|uniref:Uncharacterized protein n=1 Tax=Elysia crispata TaxID=231223 RepID=A0AAE1AT97_9GAST|nr:hypothetical protein RRG08_019213 [Elysia crispata]
MISSWRNLSISYFIHSLLNGFHDNRANPYCLKNRAYIQQLVTSHEEMLNHGGFPAALAVTRLVWEASELLGYKIFTRGTNFSGDHDRF